MFFRLSGVIFSGNFMVENTWVPGVITQLIGVIYCVILGILGFQIAPHLGTEIKKSSLPPYHRVVFSGVITVSTQTMHYYKGNPSK